MPSPIIALTLITQAYQAIGVYADGETPNAADANTGLDALNDVLEAWSLQELAVYGGLPDPFVTVAGKAIYTVGPGGDFNIARPVSSLDYLYVTLNGADFSADPWSEDDYAAVAIKTMRSDPVERFVYINDAPLGRLILYPTPNSAIPINLGTTRVLTAVASTATVLTLPPGYSRALKFALAEELRPTFASPIDVSGKARSALALIKSANRSRRTMGFDSTVMGGRPNRSSWMV